MFMDKPGPGQCFMVHNLSLLNSGGADIEIDQQSATKRAVGGNQDLHLKVGARVTLSVTIPL